MGRLLLSHIRNRLSAQTSRALLCLNSWSKMGLVKDEDVTEITQGPESAEDETAAEIELAAGWDQISRSI